MTMNKEALRRSYAVKRLALSPGEIFQLNRQICDLFFATTDLSFLAVFHCYLPIENKKEPDTWLILDRLRREYPHIKIAIPRVVENQIESFFFEGLQQLEKNAWGIPEPKNGTPVSPEDLDAVVVPLLAFDTTGHRIGYGKGYYDRFLKGCRDNCLKVGLSFFEAEEKIEDVSPFDVRLNRCITPTRVYAF